MSKILLFYFLAYELHLAFQSETSSLKIGTSCDCTESSFHASFFKWGLESTPSWLQFLKSFLQTIFKGGIYLLEYYSGMHGRVVAGEFQVFNFQMKCM